MPATRSVSSRTTRLWIVLLVALALLSFLAMRRGFVKAMGMKAEASSGTAVEQLKPGEEVKMVLELTSVKDSASVEGHVLEKQTETVYRRTPTSTAVIYDAATPVVMGKPSDIQRGAVVHITAKMADDHVLHAEKIVVLTGYIKVE
jgi:hypothetical protein